LDLITAQYFNSGIFYQLALKLNHYCRISI